MSIEPSSKPDFASDIPRALAVSAHAGTSHDPESRGRSEIEGYARTLDQDFADFGTLDGFDEYRAGYRDRFLAYLAARSRIVSTLVAGPARFPSARMAKRNEVADARARAANEWRTSRLAKFRKAMRGESNDGPIAAGDANAVESIRARLAERERFQEEAKKINAAIASADREVAKLPPTIYSDRTRSDRRLAALRSAGIAEGRLVALLTPDAFGNVGVPPYKLTNNGAEIRRLRARLGVVEQAKAAPVVEEFHTTTGIAFTDSPADNRVRLKFPGKPEDAIRSHLKRNGFRWAPSVDGGVWQAYRNERSIRIAQEIAKGT